MRSEIPREKEIAVRLTHVGKVYQEGGFSARPLWYFSRRGARGRGSAARERTQLWVTAIKDLTLDFHEGEFTVLAGPSGSGKSTLLNLIGTLDTPSQGDVHVLGRPTALLTEKELAHFRLTELGFVFQAYNLIPVLTALENVEYVLELQGVPARQREKRAREALHWVGLAELAHRRPDDLSGGQQQRVAVARALVHQPRLVLADEPTAHLDSKSGKLLLDLMRRLHDELGITFIVTSHDPVVIELADRLIEMRDGEIIREKRQGRRA